MRSINDQGRRQFLKGTGLGLLAAAGFPGWLSAMEMSGTTRRPPRTATPGFQPDVELELVARTGRISILPGAETTVMQYAARVIRATTPDTLTPMPGSYLGPLIRLRKGQKVRIHFRNELPDPTITHWHGLHVPAEVDGHPQDAIGQGQTFVYEFEVNNRASLTIYHPHPHENTARQVYWGLAGGLIVNDEEESRLGLPAGDYEIPLVLQDRLFDSNNQLIYVRHPMDRMTGFYGDRILVNGRPNQTLEVASRAYRLRVLNGSTARIYKLGWDDGTPLTVIGVDGGLLEKPVTRPYVMLAPGERLDVWADFSGRPVGSELTLKSLPFSGVLPAMLSGRGGHSMGGMMGGMGGHEMGGGMMGGMGGHEMGGGRMGGMGGHGMGGGGMMGGMGGHGMGGGGMMGGMGDHAMGGDRMGGMGDHAMGGDRMGGMGDHAMGGGGMMGGMGGHAMGGGGMMGGMGGMHSSKLPVGSEYPLLRIKVTRKVSDSPSLPTHLSRLPHYGIQDVANPDHPIPLGISEGPMSMLLNGQPYGKGGLLPFERVPLNSVQLLEIFHAHGDMSGGGHRMDGDAGGMGSMGGMGMMFSMAHPIHLHGQSFRILSRTIDADESSDYATVREGFIDEGLKDTVLVMPGERVKLIKPFADYKGLFMYHCHNLEHEDMGMMREFLIE